MNQEQQALRRRSVITLRSLSTNGELSKSPPPVLGVIRLDYYDYPAALGDIDHPGSFSYPVVYCVVPGLSFEMCQTGQLTCEVEEKFVQAVKYLDDAGVRGITGNCGYMMYFQELARKHTNKPVFLSALMQVSAMVNALNASELIAIFTANKDTMEPMNDLIYRECGIQPDDAKYIIVDCRLVPGFEAVAAGGRVDVKKVEKGMVDLALSTIQKYKNLRAFVFECTELPAYSDTVRQATGLPVYDAVTMVDFFMSGFLDNVRFGKNDWQETWKNSVDFNDIYYEIDLRKPEEKSLYNPAHDESSSTILTN